MAVVAVSGWTVVWIVLVAIVALAVLVALWSRGAKIAVVGVFLFATPVLITLLLVEVWPVVEKVADGQFKEMAGATIHADVLGFDANFTPDLSYLAMVILVGMLGSFIHTATSFATYVGNGTFGHSWIWWYALRPFTGAALALLLYFAVLGGLVSLSDATGSVSAGDINPYGIAAIAGLAGMFSKTVADKLQDVFEALFTSNRDAARGHKLADPAIESLEPETVAAGAENFTLKILGRFFVAGSKVRVGTAEAVPGTIVSEGEIHVQIAGPVNEDVEVVVIGPEGRTSTPKTLRVETGGVNGDGGGGSGDGPAPDEAGGGAELAPPATDPVPGAEAAAAGAVLPAPPGEVPGTVPPAPGVPPAAPEQPSGPGMPAPDTGG